MRTDRRDDKSQLLDTLVRITESGSVPEGLSLAKTTLLNKLKAESARFEAEFVDNDELLSTPGMGMVRVTHETLDDFKPLFGANIKTRHVTRIQLFNASQRKEDGTVVRGKLISDVCMSEKQFADIIVNSNTGTGYPVTIERLMGVDVNNYDPELDVTKKKMRRLGKKIASPSSQVTRFLKEVDELLDTAEEKGRLGKTEIKEMEKLIGMVHGHLLSNSQHDITQLKKELESRVNEAVLNTHFSVNHLALMEKG